MHPFVAFSQRLAWSVRGSLSLLILEFAVMLVVPAPALHAATPSVTFTGVQTVPFSGLGKGLAVDSSGNVYLAEASHVYRETPTPTGFSQTTVASNTQGLSYAVAVAVDSSGNVYIADQSNAKVLKETYSGGSYTNSTLVVDTVNLTDLVGIAVDGFGNVYVLDGNNGVYKIQGVSVLPVSTSSLSYATGLAADAAGNLYIADSNHHRVLKENYNAGSFTESTLANSSNGLVYPGGVGVDAGGNVYITDYDLIGTNVVFKETYSGGSYTQSQLPFSGLDLPSGIGVDGSGNIFLDDEGNDRFLELSTQPVNFGSVAVNSSSTMALNFTIAANVAVGSIDELTTGVSGLDFSDAGSSTCVPGTTGAALSCVVNVKLKPQAAGARSGAVVFFSGASDTGTVLASVLVYGVGTGPQIAFGPGTPIAIAPTVNSETLFGGGGVASDAAGDLFIADYGHHRIVEYPAGGGTATAIGPTLTGGIALGPVSGVAVDGAGDLFIADADNNRIVEVPVGGGAAIAIAPAPGGTDLYRPYSVAVDAAGDVFIGDYNNSRVVEVSSDGGVVTAIDPLASGETLDNPLGLAVDSAGDLFIGDYNHDRVVEVPAGGGAATVVAGGVTFSEPRGMAVDAAGDLFIADGDNDRVVEVPAGSSTGYVIAPTVNATPLGYADALALDSVGDLFILDSTNNRVVELQGSTPPSLTFDTTNVGSTSGDSPQTVEAVNIGNQALMFKGLSYPTDFPYAGSGTNPCTSSISLSAGEECDLDVDFTPQSAGAPLSEDVTLTDNALNVTGAQQMVGVSGTSAGGLAGFTVTGPNPAPWYTADTLTITAVDGLGNTDAGFNGTVTLTGTDPQMGFIPTNQVTLTNGVGYETVVFKTAGNDSVTATDNANSSITGTGTFSVSPGPAHSFVVSATSPATSGAPINFTVTAYDASSNVATGYTGTVTFTTTDPSSQVVLPVPSMLTNGTGTFQATLATPGTQTITATDAVTFAPTYTVQGISNGITVVAPNYVVTVTEDGVVSAKACTAQATPEVGTDLACSLRNALINSAFAGAGNITFNAATFGTAPATTFPVINGVLDIPSNTTVTGLTSGSGATLTNLTIVNAEGNSEVFYVDVPVTGAAINNLIVTGGAGAIESYKEGGFDPVTGRGLREATTRSHAREAERAHGVRPFAEHMLVVGGGLMNNGVLTVTNSTISGNTVSDPDAVTALGGGILNNGTLTLIGSTVSGNTATGNGPSGGGIFSDGTLTLNDSTISGNSVTGGGSGQGGGIYADPGTPLTIANSTISANTADGQGGGIYYPAPSTPQPALANAIVAGNTAQSSSDISVAYADNGGNQVGGTIDLAPLNSYGGPTQTMPPLPGSPAICYGLPANATAAGITTDQRGFVFDPACSTYATSLDSGAAQANYALAFTTQPPASALVGAKLSPAPVVQLTESGQVIPSAAGAVVMSDSAPALGGTLSASLASGSATFSDLLFTTAALDDTLTATLTLNSALTPPAAVSTSALSTVNGDTLAALTSPAPSSTLPGSSVNFSWSPGIGATGYALWLGTMGRGSNDLYSSGTLKGTSATVNLPTNGGTLYVRLFTDFNGTWVSVNYLLTAASQAVMVTPMANSDLSGFSTTFTWTPSAGASGYKLWVGSTIAGSNDIYSGALTTGSTATANVPPNGETVYARLFTELNGAWAHTDYTYTAPTLTLGALTYPAQSGYLDGPSTTFTWSAGVGATGYKLWVGTTLGSNDLYPSTVELGPSVTSVMVPDLPTNGETVYARFYTDFNGVWKHIDYNFIAGSMSALTSPAPGSTLAGPSVTFTWTPTTNASGYDLWLGSTGVASDNLYSSGKILDPGFLSVTVPDLPTNSGQINARLYILIGGVWSHLDYVYTAGSAPAIVSPAPSTQLTGPAVTFNWSTGGGVTAYDLWVGTMGTASHDLYVSGVTTAASANLTNLPVNGEFVYARLYMEVNGVWSHLDYTYTAYAPPAPAP